MSDEVFYRDYGQPVSLQGHAPSSIYRSGIEMSAHERAAFEAGRCPSCGHKTRSARDDEFDELIRDADEYHEFLQDIFNNR